MGKHKSVVCEKCYRVMRSDYLKIHIMNRHQKRLDTETLHTSNISSIRSLINKDNDSKSELLSSTFVNKPSNLDEERIIRKLKMDKAEYTEKIILGEMIHKNVIKYEIPEACIPIEYKGPLDLYMKQKQCVDTKNIILKYWQQDLLNYMKPSDRELIWVYGTNGNEGKSWFQKFTASKLGFDKVVCGLDIKNKTSSICHILSKRSLITIDTYLFNVSRSQNEYEKVNYEVLEQIKDGKIITSKYDTKELKLVTPNIVVIFSNYAPDTKQMSKDRWTIFSIRNDDLIVKTKSELKQSTEKKDYKGIFTSPGIGIDETDDVNHVPQAKSSWFGGNEQSPQLVDTVQVQCVPNVVDTAQVKPISSPELPFVSKSSLNHHDETVIVVQAPKRKLNIFDVYRRSFNK